MNIGKYVELYSEDLKLKKYFKQTKQVKKNRVFLQ